LGESVSQRKLAANRANALVSTGPRTAAGKAVSSRNARRHGLLSSQVVLESEDPQELASLRKDLVAHLSPVGSLEELLVDRIVTGFWRLRRANRVERALMEDRHRERMEGADQESRLVTLTGGPQDDDIDQGLERWEARRPRLALIDMVANETLEKILRYETAIERQIYRALHELQRLQGAQGRAGAVPPLALDVDISGGTLPSAGRARQRRTGNDGR